MDKYTEKLFLISENIGGVQAIAFVGFDGMVISGKKNNFDSDLDYCCAELSTVINNVKKIDNSSNEIIITSSKNIIIMKLMNDGFVCAFMGLDGNLGRAKMNLHKLEGDFYV